MEETFYRIYTRVIRKFINLPPIKRIIIKAFPLYYSLSESIYIRYKDTESRLLDLLCDKNKSSLDIGALWGGYTFMMRRFSQKVYSFEPNIENYSFLKSSFANDKKVEILNYAVSDKMGNAEFRVPANNPGNATIERKNTLDNFSDVNTYSVKTAAIDELNLKNIGFIKIDIEGHEYPAIEGMKNTLRKERPVLLIEIENRHNPYSLDMVKESMISLNYKSYFLKNKSILPIEEFDAGKHQLNYQRNTDNYINNFIFIPAEKCEHFLNALYKKGITEKLKQ